MTCDKTTTNRLRELLDERGVKYTPTIVTEGVLFTVVTSNETYFILVRDSDAGIEMWSQYLTPEQAVEVTLGRGTCELINAADDLGKGTQSCMCYACGYTALDDWWDEFNYCPNCGRKVME